VVKHPQHSPCSSLTRGPLVVRIHETTSIPLEARVIVRTTLQVFILGALEQGTTIRASMDLLTPPPTSLV